MSNMDIPLSYTSLQTDKGKMLQKAIIFDRDYLCVKCIQNEVGHDNLPRIENILDNNNLPRIETF